MDSGRDSSLAGRLVTIVNGDTARLDSLVRIARESGLEARGFRLAEDVLTFIRATRTPDLIVTDLHLPRIDGWRFCQLLRSPEFVVTNNIPVLVTSSIFSGEDVEEISRDLGASGFLSMPCEAGVFRQAMLDLLQGKAPLARPLALVVEDDTLNAQLIERGLRQHGYDVELAATGAAAREAFRRVRPAAVFLDHHLEDVTGAELLVEFKQPGSSAVVIVMTGDMSAELAVEYSHNGVDGFVHKPCDVKYLVNLVIKAQRQRALLRVEDILSSRIQALHESSLMALQSARLTTIGGLAAGIAHEINNPLAGIMNCAEILSAELEVASPMQTFARTIRTESERIATIVRRLVTFMKQDPEELAEAGLGEIVANAVALVGSRIRRGNITATVDIPEGLPWLRCRPVQIQQVVMNLLLNACEALGERPANAPGPRAIRISGRLATAQGRRAFILDVEDTGVGLSDETRRRLFDPFLTTKKDHAGLGLSVSQDIVKNHGGTITVESRKDEFTRCRVTLPLPAGDLPGESA